MLKFSADKLRNVKERREIDFDAFCERKGVLDAYIGNQTNNYPYSVSYYVVMIIHNRVCVLRRARGRENSPLYLVVSKIRRKRLLDSDFCFYTSAAEAEERMRSIGKYKDISLYEMYPLEDKRFYRLEKDNCWKHTVKILFLSNLSPELSDGMYMPLTSLKAVLMALLLLP